MILKFQASQRLKKLKLISSKNRTIKFFCSFFVRAVIHSLEFRCAFKQDQVDFLLEKLLLSLNSTVFRASGTHCALRMNVDKGCARIPVPVKVQAADLL